jgi:exonuclease SbcC
MVSLALALALSSMGREGISMDTLFIDEGFGTLSTDNQIRVIDLLQTLQRT